jgi:hypothetical protein
MKDQMQAMGMSIGNAVSGRTLLRDYDTNPFHQEMYCRDLDVEVGKLESREGVDSAQAATASSHKDWLDIDVSAQKSLSNLFSSSRAQKVKLENEKILREEKYIEQGESRTSDHHAYLMLVSRSEISSYSISTATEPKTIPQLYPGSSSGQTNVVHLGLD